MKKNLFLVTLICGFLYVVLSSHSIGPGTAASLDCTGVIGPGGCGGPTCHGTTPSTEITDTIIVMDASGASPSYFVPGAVYTLRIRGFNNSTSILPKFGFQITAVKAGTDTSLGTFITTPSIHWTFATPSLIVAEQPHLLSCSGTGGFGSFYQADVQWIAPSPGTGSVSFSAIVNAVDANGTAGPEDHWPLPGSSITLHEAPPTVTGPPSLCTGSSAMFSASASGGTWSSSDASIAAVSSGGVVTAVAAGYASISYTTSTASGSKSVTINPTPAAIAGISAVCAGGTSTLTDAILGGTWISSNPSVAIVGSTSGVVSGIAATGITTITYKVSSTSCYTTRLFTVALSASVTGTPDICAGNSSLFTHPFAGGIWYSSNPSVATVGTSGLVTGVAPGTSTISYSLSTTGCDAAKSVTVNSTPVAISGASIVCLYHTVILTGTPAGGTWSSSDVSKVTVDASSGIVTGVSNGTATIMYSATTTCTGSTTSVVTTSSSGNCVSGVGDPFALAKELRIFPNPNKGTFSLDVPGTIDEEAHIIVTNIVGEKVKEFDLTTNAVNNVSLGQPAGVYFLSATTLNSKYFVKIVVE